MMACEVGPVGMVRVIGAIERVTCIFGSTLGGAGSTLGGACFTLGGGCSLGGTDWHGEIARMCQASWMFAGGELGVGVYH